MWKKVHVCNVNPGLINPVYDFFFLEATIKKYHIVTTNWRGTPLIVINHGLAKLTFSINYGKSPFSMAKSTISIAIFNSYVSHRVPFSIAIFNSFVISTINHSYWSYWHQLSYRTGVSHCMCVYVTCRCTCFFSPMIHPTISICACHLSSPGFVWSGIPIPQICINGLY